MSDQGIGLGRPHTERVYVKVTAEFDSTGYMQPVAITWSDVPPGWDGRERFITGHIYGCDSEKGESSIF